MDLAAHYPEHPVFRYKVIPVTEEAFLRVQIPDLFFTHGLVFCYLQKQFDAAKVVLADAYTVFTQLGDLLRFHNVLSRERTCSGISVPRTKHFLEFFTLIYAREILGQTLSVFCDTLELIDAHKHNIQTAVWLNRSEAVSHPWLNVQQITWFHVKAVSHAVAEELALADHKGLGAERMLMISNWLCFPIVKLHAVEFILHSSQHRPVKLAVIDTARCIISGIVTIFFDIHSDQIRIFSHIYPSCFTGR